MDSALLADFGRAWLLKEASGLDQTKTFEALNPLREPIYHEPNGDLRAAEELRRHAAKGDWETIGAWQFASDFVRNDALERDLTDLALLAMMKMRITNLRIHLPFGVIRRYEELTGGPVPDDGFRGPPVFDSQFEPPLADRER